MAEPRCMLAEGLTELQLSNARDDDVSNEEKVQRDEEPGRQMKALPPHLRRKMEVA